MSSENIKKILTFRWMDVISLFFGFGLMWTRRKPDDVFVLLTEPMFYFALLFVLLCLQALIWLIVYRAETDYLIHLPTLTLRNFFNVIFIGGAAIAIYFWCLYLF